jgi:hypothetical protein
LATPGCQHSIYLSQMVIKIAPRNSRKFKKLVFWGRQIPEARFWNFLRNAWCAPDDR